MVSVFGTRLHMMQRFEKSINSIKYDKVHPHSANMLEPKL